MNKKKTYGYQLGTIKYIAAAAWNCISFKITKVIYIIKY